MAGRYQHIKHYVDFLGIDLRSSDVLRPRGFASEGTENVVHSPEGALTQRWGTHIMSRRVGCYGIFPFETTDLLGVTKKELVGVGTLSGLTDSARAWRLVKSSFTITNAVVDDYSIYHFYDETAGEFVFRITTDSGVNLVDEDLGLGTEVPTAYMLSDLETAVDGSPYSLTMSTPVNASTTPAAFMELLNGLTLPGSGSATIYYWYWEAIPQGVASSADTEFSNENLIPLDSYRNVSATEVGGVLYLANPMGRPEALSVNKRLLKYDGNRIYIAGLPSPYVSPALSSNSAFYASGTASGTKSTDVRGSISVASPLVDLVSSKFRFRYVNIDKAGNRVEGPVYEDETEVFPNPTNVYQAGSVVADPLISGVARNNAWGKASSAQTGVLTVNVTSGHTLRIGDIGYFWDNNQTRFIQREITARTATSVTFSTTSIDTDQASDNYDAGGNVNVLNNALITNNARIAVFREIDDVYYLLAETPNWLVTGLSVTYTFHDNRTNEQIADRPNLLDDAYPHDPPPLNCSQISSYNGGLILSGNPKSPRTAYFSDVDGPEYFPSVTHNLEMPARVTGHKQSGEFLVVGTPLSLHVTSGILSEFNSYRIDQIGKNIGVQAHLSMEEIGEGILVFSSNVGPQVLVSGRDLQPLGGLEYPDGARVSRLLPFWTKRYPRTAEKPVFERSVACVLPDDKLYLLFVPFEDPARPTFATSSSVIWVFDYGRGAWWQWTGLNAAGGMAFFEGALYLTSRYHDGGGGVTSSRIISHCYQQQREVDVGVYAYADHNQPTDWVFRSHWESLGNPKLFKRFLRCGMSSHEGRLAPSTAMTLKTYVDFSVSNLSFESELEWTDELELTEKVKGESCKSMMIEFFQSARYQPMLITGYEIEAVAPFRPEMKE